MVLAPEQHGLDFVLRLRGIDNRRKATYIYLSCRFALQNGMICYLQTCGVAAR